MKKQYFMLFIFICCAFRVYSGEIFSSLYLDYYRYTDLLGISEPDTLGFHTYSGNTRDYDDKRHPWAEHMGQSRSFKTGEKSQINIEPATAELSYNSFNLTRGTNDGLQWQGKGSEQLSFRRCVF